MDSLGVQNLWLYNMSLYQSLLKQYLLLPRFLLWYQGLHSLSTLEHLHYSELLQLIASIFLYFINQKQQTPVLLIIYTQLKTERNVSSCGGIFFQKCILDITDVIKVHVLYHNASYRADLFCFQIY